MSGNGSMKIAENSNYSILVKRRGVDQLSSPQGFLGVIQNSIGFIVVILLLIGIAVMIYHGLKKSNAAH